MRSIDGPSNDSEVERFNLERQLNQKYSALEKLMKQIQDLVGQSGTLLEKFLAAPKGDGASAREDSSFDSMSSLSGEVMALLDSNARLALQLQNLG